MFRFFKTAAAILDFKISEILLADAWRSRVSRGPKDIVVPNFLKIGQSVAVYLRINCNFSILGGGRPPFRICLGLIWATHEEYIAVSVVVQNLVTMDVVVYEIRKFQYFVVAVQYNKLLNCWQHLRRSMNDAVEKQAELEMRGKA